MCEIHSIPPLSVPQGILPVRESFKLGYAPSKRNDVYQLDNVAQYILN